MHDVPFLKVKGVDGLVRDTSNKAIINNNSEEHRKYVLAREKARKERLSRDSTKEEIQELRSELAEIKSMLTQLLNK